MHVGGAAKGGIARLTSAGVLDASFAPTGAANGPVHAIVPIPSNKYLIAGDFTEYAGQPRPRIARIFADGTLDTTFAPTAGPDGAVHAIVVTSYGYVFGGEFTKVGASVRNRLARFTTTGALDTVTFDGGPNGAVYALYYDGRNNITAGGDFTAVGAQPRSHLATFDSFPGRLLSYWTQDGTDGPVYAICPPSPRELTADPSVVIAGNFSTILGRPRSNVALVKLNTGFSSGSGSLDDRLRIWVNNPVHAAAWSVDGHLLLGGAFTVVDGFARYGYARFRLPLSSPPSSSATAAVFELDLSFESGTGANGNVRAVASTKDGRSLLLGSFSQVLGSARPGAARLYGPAGANVPTAPSAFAISPIGNKEIYLRWTVPSYTSGSLLERQKEGETNWQPVPAVSGTSHLDVSLEPGTTYSYRVSAFNSNGTGPSTASLTATTLEQPWTGPGIRLPDPFETPVADGTISAMIVLPDGKILIAGSFTNVFGVPRRHIARLLPDYSVDPGFDPGTSTNTDISAIAMQEDGKIYIAGSFTTVGGVSRNRVARLLPSGGLDSSFNPGTGPNASISRLRIQPGHGLLISGSFSKINDVERDGIARLRFDGSLDQSFEVTTDFFGVDNFDLAPDGSIFVCGWFKRIDGIARSGLARLLPNGRVDVGFNPVGANLVQDVIAQNDGRVFVIYTSPYAGSYLARLTDTGARDPSFIAPVMDISPTAALVQPDNKIVLAGSFRMISGQTRLGFARLLESGELDSGFNPGVGGLNATVYSLASRQDGSILVGGLFSSWAGTPAERFALVKGDPVSTPPTMPTDLQVLALSSSELQLRWNDANGEFRYVVERSADGMSGWEQIAVLPWDMASCIDTGLQPGHVYFYRVQAANIAGTATSAPIFGQTFTTYQQWKLERGMPIGTAGDDLDDDQDGIPAIMEYALGLDPTERATDGLPVYQLLNGAVALSYRKFRNDVTYVVESSTNLTDWTTTGVNQGFGAFPIAWSLIGPEPQKFLRLRVTAQ